MHSLCARTHSLLPLQWVMAERYVLHWVEVCSRAAGAHSNPPRECHTAKIVGRALCRYTFVGNMWHEYYACVRTTLVHTVQFGHCPFFCRCSLNCSTQLHLNLRKLNDSLSIQLQCINGGGCALGGAFPQPPKLVLCSRLARLLLRNTSHGELKPTKRVCCKWKHFHYVCAICLHSHLSLSLSRSLAIHIQRDGWNGMNRECHYTNQFNSKYKCVQLSKAPR